MPGTKRSRLTGWAVAALSLLMARPSVAGPGTLHEQIDQAIAAKAGGALSPAASDAEFLRRAWLDLAGGIPTAEQARAFLDDKSFDKRQKLIDQLLARPEYADRMADAFDVMLMERRTGADAGSKAWRAYLRDSFAANKPWDRIARELLSPESDDPALRPAALFYTKRLEKVGANPTDYPGMTRDIGRLFLGVDLKCAQCHNHIYIKEYKQADFQGLLAAVGQTFIRTDLKFPAIGEKPLAAKVEYVSVFHPDEKRLIGPRVPMGMELELQPAAKGQEWAKPPDKKTNFPGEPKFRVLPALAMQLTASDNLLFRKNAANRLWFLMLGRGLIHPMDLTHKDNPSSHPELLDQLADELAGMQFDTKRFIRELTLTQTYQRSSLQPEAIRTGSGQPGEVKPESYRAANLKRVSAEQLARAMLIATGELERSLTASPAKPAPKPAADDQSDGGEAATTTSAGAAVHIDEVRKKFAAAFAAPAGEAEVEFAPSVAGALFVSNEKLILDWLKPRSGNLMDRLMKLDDPAKVTEELYLSVLTRKPEPAEVDEVREHLKQHAADRETALRELAWALLASTEFCVNH